MNITVLGLTNPDVNLKIMHQLYIVTGILKLIGSLRCFKGTKLMDMVLDKCIFQIRFPYLQ